jgi:hypothetical protein
MVGAGLDDETIILSINKGNNDFDTSPDGLIALKENKVSDKVMKAMLAGGKGADEETHNVDSNVPDEARSDVVVHKGLPQLRESSLPANVIRITLPPNIVPQAGGEYYTRFSFHVEKGQFITTNYARGEVLPVNTKVQLVSKGGSAMKLKVVSTGVTIKVVNKEGYSGRDIDGIAEYMLSSEPTPIEKFQEEVSGAIKAGELRIGMTKQQALLARGYPPAHQTGSLDADTWKYWNSKFVIQTVVFRDGILVEGRGLR